MVLFIILLITIILTYFNYDFVGGIDLFIYIQVDPSKASNQTLLNEWDGDPSTYEPTIGDYRICDIYTNHQLFAPETGTYLLTLLFF